MHTAGEICPLYLISSKPSVLNGVVCLFLSQLTRLHDPATFDCPTGRCPTQTHTGHPAHSVVTRCRIRTRMRLFISSVAKVGLSSPTEMIWQRQHNDCSRLALLGADSIILTNRGSKVIKSHHEKSREMHSVLISPHLLPVDCSHGDRCILRYLLAP
jgi:hypothetical protein